MADALVGTDDYSRTFATLRGKLIGGNGECYVAFVRGLKPRCAIVYRDIAVGYVLLAVSFSLTVIAPAWGIPKLIAALLGACFVGYWVAYLQLFLHEGAHMGNRRMTRLTNAFSKKAENHVHMMAIYFMHYNFVRLHQTLMITPAMAAIVTPKLWEMTDMVKVLEEWERAQ